MHEMTYELMIWLGDVLFTVSSSATVPPLHSFLISNCEHSSALSLIPLICELLLRFDEFELLELLEFELLLLLLLLLELELLSLSLSSLLAAAAAVAACTWFAVLFAAVAAATAAAAAAVTDRLLYVRDDL